MRKRGGEIFVQTSGINEVVDLMNLRYHCFLSLNLFAAPFQIQAIHETKSQNNCKMPNKKYAESSVPKHLQNLQERCVVGEVLESYVTGPLPAVQLDQ